MRPLLRQSLARLRCVAVWLAATAAAHPQTPTGANATQPATSAVGPRAAERREPLARYIPIEASFYFRMSQADKWQALFGRERAAPGQDLRRLLEGQPRAIAMPTWRQRKEMITLCAPANPAAFETALRISPQCLELEDGRLRVYQPAPGLWAATNRQVYIFSDVGMGSGLFAPSAKMLTDRTRRSLLQDVRFRRYAAAMESAASGLLFMDESWALRQGEADPLQSARPRWLPDLQSGCIGIDIRPDAIHCEVRCQRRAMHSAPQLGINPAQLKMIPQQAIMVWMMPAELISILEFAIEYLPRAQPSFYRQLARTLADSELKGVLPPEIGPRSTWCLLPGRSAGALRMAFILEAKQAAVAADTLAQICRGVASILSAQRGPGQHEAAFRTTGYKTHAIHELTLTLREETGLGGLVRELHPAVAAVRDQLVIASDPSVIQQVIDAAHHPDYALPVAADWAGAALGSGPSATQIRGYINPKEIGRQLRPIQQALRDHDSDWWQSGWFQSLKDYFRDTPVQLGARLRRNNAETPGKVYVMQVLEGHAAAGKLQPGDYIVGVDGQALALDNPIADLRDKLLDRSAGNQRVLRIERRGQLGEVRIDLPQVSDKSIAGLLNDTGKAMEYLDALGDIVQSITYHQYGNHPIDLQAELLFHLRKAAPVSGRPPPPG